MPPRDGSTVDPSTAGRPRTALLFGLALIALIALGVWASARLFDPTGGIDPLLATAAVLAAASSARAAGSLVRLGREGTRTWPAAAWFSTTILALLLLDLVSALSRHTG